MARASLIVFSALLWSSWAARVDLGANAQARELELEKEWSAALPPNPETKQVAAKSPIKRVVGLLNKMKAELEHEAANEAEMYDKMVCWCETTEKEKVKAIADAEAKEKDLEAEIEERAARRGVLETEIGAMKKQIAKDTASLEEATSVQEGSAGDGRDRENELVQAISNLRNAVSVLSKTQGGSALIQIDTPTMSSLHAVLRDVAFKYEMMLGDDPKVKSALTKPLETAFLQEGKEGANRELLSTLDTRSGFQPAMPVEFAAQVLQEQAKRGKESAFLQANAPGKMKSYNSQGGAIFGILKQMLEEFEANLAELQKESKQGSADYEALAAEKTQQIAIGKEKLDAMEGDLSANVKALSDAKEDLGLTRKQRASDIEFLRNLRVTCQDLDRQWEARSKTRGQETRAVAETIAILTEDDARDLMRKTVTFLQESSETNAMRVARGQAAALLRRSAEDPSFDADDLLAAWHSRKGAASITTPRSRLSTLAVSVQLDAFTKVKAAMDKMIADLKKEQQEEAEFKAQCTKDLNDNEKATYEADELKTDYEHDIERLAALMKKLTEEIAEATEQIADTKTEVLKASQDREKENAAFQTVVADQRATQEILKKALARLEAFYGKEGGGNTRPEDAVGLVQQTPPVQFGSYKKNAGASPVIGMIQQIVEDSVKLENEAMEGEASAQADYEKLVKDSNDLIKDLTDAITAKTKGKAGANLESDEAKENLESTVRELEALDETNGQLHGQCDFVLNNFAIRQKARGQEIEAIGQAKGILSGAGGTGGIDKA